MTITIEFHGQLRHLAQTASIIREFKDAPSIPSVLESIRDDYNEVFRSILFDADGSVSSTAMILLGDEQVDRDNWPTLSDGDVITLLPPIAGG